MPAPPLKDEVLWETIEALKQAKGIKQYAANALGIPANTFKHRLEQAITRGLIERPLVVKKQSILRDTEGNEECRWDKLSVDSRPEELAEHIEPRRVTKISTLYDQEGRVTQQWVSEKPQDVNRELAWRAFADELAKPLPRLEALEAPSGTAKDRMFCLPVGDHHMGMAAWREETGAAWNIDIAEKTFKNAVGYLMATSAACEQALLVFLGDFLHYDSWEPVTPIHRNQLDADGRFPQMVRAAVRCMRFAIDRALEKHLFVHVIVEIGNHDLASSIFLVECLANVYENEARITIDTSPRHFHYFRWHKNLIGTHHGHGSKLEQLPLIMATDVPKDWGETTHRFIWTGHVHHSQKLAQIQKDHVGVEVESFRVLAAPDAYAAQRGYRSARDMKAIIMHKDHGEISRITVTPDMLG